MLETLSGIVRSEVGVVGRSGISFGAQYIHMVSSICVTHSTSFLTLLPGISSYSLCTNLRLIHAGIGARDFDVGEVDNAGTSNVAVGIGAVVVAAGAGATTGAGAYVAGEVVGTRGGVTDVGDCVVIGTYLGSKT